MDYSLPVEARLQLVPMHAALLHPPFGTALRREQVRHPRIAPLVAGDEAVARLKRAVLLQTPGQRTVRSQRASPGSEEKGPEVDDLAQEIRVPAVENANSLPLSSPLRRHGSASDLERA